MADLPEPAQEILREFLDAERSCPEPPAGTQDRVLARLSTTLGLVPGLGDSLATPSGPSLAPAPVRPRPWGPVLGGITGRGLATFLVGAAVGATVYGTAQRIGHRPEPASPPATIVVSPVPMPPVVAPAPMPQVEAAATALSATKPLAASQGHHENEPALGELKARDRNLAAERKLVEMARSALARGHTEGAIAALRRHVHQFPNGQLAEERDSLLVQTLVAKGDFAQARVRARSFERQHPHSLFSPVVEQALKSIP